MRYPLTPLLEAARINQRQAQTRLGVSGTAMEELAACGIPEHLADRYACRLGLHPAEVWDEWVTEGLTPLDALFIEGGWRQAWLWKERATA